MKKLVLFGDSLFGRFGKHLIIKLEEALPDYDIYNCAAGGWDSDDCVAKAPYISGLKPDVMIISLGTNDACPWKQVDLEIFRANLPKIFKSFNDSQIVYFLPPPVSESKLASDEKRSTLTNEIMKQYHDTAQQVCDEYGVAYLNSWQVFGDMIKNQQDYHVEDGIHLNEYGYNLSISELVKVVGNE